MIINFYIPENDAKLINQLKLISEKKRRSFSFIVREALESYLLGLNIPIRDLDPSKKKENEK